MRLLGAVLIVMASVVLAIDRRARMHTRVRELDGLCGMILRLSAELRRNRPPLARLICRAGAPEPFAVVCEKRLSGGEDFHAAWRYACEHTPAVLLLTAEEQSHMLRLGEQLGRGDVATELRLLEEYYDRLADCRQNAREQLDGRVKVSTACLVLGGMLLAVLLI